MKIIKSMRFLQRWKSILHSFQLIAASLNKLSQSLEANQFKILKEKFPYPTESFLLKHKGIYPYEYMGSLKKIQETKLPPKSKFYSTLSGENITDEDYSHDLKVWHTFNIQNLGEYHDLYVKRDLILLADIFQNFRDLCLKNYEIDPIHLITSPALSWQTCMKTTEVQ